jgi:pilus assembly protein CpaB
MINQLRGTKMGGRNLLFVGLAVALGLIAVILANSYFRGVETRQQRVAQEQRLARIVVATRPLEFGEPLTNENLRLANFPASSVPDGAFRSVEDATRGGRVALRPIVVNEPVLSDKVSGADGRAVLASNLAPGMRAVSIPVNAVAGVSGFIRPGDVVDILLTRSIPGSEGNENMMTDVILDRVKVLAIDQNPNEKDTKPKVGKTAVVEVDLYQAQKLVLAQKLGALSLALRNVAQPEQVAMTTVTARDLGGAGVRYAGVSRPRAVQPAGMFAPRVPTFPAVAPPPASGPASPAVRPKPAGPTMTIYRGVESTEESVGRLGGS